MKSFYIIMFLFSLISCEQDNKTSNPEKKEIEMFSKILIKSQFQNSKENFENINKELLGINTKDLKEGYNQIEIFSESSDYQISKNEKYIKIGHDVLPDIDKIKEEDLNNFPYMKSVINLNKIIYQNDLTSILTISNTDIDLARDIVVLFDCEKNDILLKKVADNIGDLNDYTNNFKLSIIFYNKNHTIRKKFLQYLSKNQELIYHITFFLADNRNKIIVKNKLADKDIYIALAFLLNLGLEGRANDDVYTGNDASYELLNNIYISYPSLIQLFEKNNYFEHEDLKYFTKIFHTEQENNVGNPQPEYFIQDPDGFSNLRKEKNSSSEVLQKIKSGENIEVIDNIGDWWQVKTKEGKTGYVHKSRVKSGNSNNHSTSFFLYDRPDFSSFSKQVVAKNDIEIVHQNLGWNFVKVNDMTGYLPTEEKKEELQKEEKNKFSFLAEDEGLKPEKKKGFWNNLLG